MIKELTDIDFAHEIESSPLLSVVYFWAIWSPVCISIGQALEEVDKKFAHKLLIGKVNVDNEIKTANDYDIQNIPTLIFFYSGNEKERIVGSISKELLIKKIKQHVPAKPGKKEKK
jgi:thioredoxin 1